MDHHTHKSATELTQAQQQTSFVSSQFKQSVAHIMPIDITTLLCAVVVKMCATHDAHTTPEYIWIDIQFKRANFERDKTTTLESATCMIHTGG